MTTHILIATVLLLTVYAQLIIKALALFHASGGEVTERLWYLFHTFIDIGVLSGCAAAILAGACWMLAIDRTDLNYAYPFMALTFVLVPIGSMLVFGEKLRGTEAESPCGRRVHRAIALRPTPPTINEEPMICMGGAILCS